MIISRICVLIVVFILISVGGMLLSKIFDDCSEFLLTPYIFACMGFSFFLCIYLVQKGVI